MSVGFQKLIEKGKSKGKEAYICNTAIIVALYMNLLHWYGTWRPKGAPLKINQNTMHKQRVGIKWHEEHEQRETERNIPEPRGGFLGCGIGPSLFLLQTRPFSSSEGQVKRFHFLEPQSSLLLLNFSFLDNQTDKKIEKICGDGDWQRIWQREREPRTEFKENLGKQKW